MKDYLALDRLEFGNQESNQSNLFEMLLNYLATVVDLNQISGSNKYCSSIDSDAVQMMMLSGQGQEFWHQSKLVAAILVSIVKFASENDVAFAVEPEGMGYHVGKQKEDSAALSTSTLSVQFARQIEILLETCSKPATMTSRAASIESHLKMLNHVQTNAFGSIRKVPNLVTSENAWVSLAGDYDYVTCPGNLIANPSRDATKLKSVLISSRKVEDHTNTGRVQSGGDRLSAQGAGGAVE
ncbi:hypothetical protein K438DRAFT_1947561 [Mycena galopus ATCC 62051]|nr:hypothetical protein K438DRAFT_1947561 [Mycena galopus ATCC 62051]